LRIRLRRLRIRRRCRGLCSDRIASHRSPPFLFFFFSHSFYYSSGWVGFRLGTGLRGKVERRLSSPSFQLFFLIVLCSVEAKRWIEWGAPVFTELRSRCFYVLSPPLSLPFCTCTAPGAAAFFHFFSLSPLYPSFSFSALRFVWTGLARLGIGWDGLDISAAHWEFFVREISIPLFVCLFGCFFLEWEWEGSLFYSVLMIGMSGMMG
jgi:hypothetical protein